MDLNHKERHYFIERLLLIAGNMYDMVMIFQKKYSKIKMKLPNSMIKKMHYLMQMVKPRINIYSFILCILIGFLIGCGEFLCTGQVYLGTIVLLLKNNIGNTYYNTMLLVLYDIAFVIPLIVSSLLVYKGIKVIRISSFFTKRMWLIKTLNVIVFSLFIIFYLRG